MPSGACVMWTRPITPEENTMIIDCHGHYTTPPAAHREFHDALHARLASGGGPDPAPAAISDDAIPITKLTIATL